MSNFIKNETIAEILNSYNSGEISREETDRQLLALIELEERKPFHKMDPQKLAEHEWALYGFRTGKPLVTQKEEGLAKLYHKLASTRYKPKAKSRIFITVTVLALLGIGLLLVYLHLR